LDVRTIASTKDLRKTNYGDLFYEIFENPDAKAVVNRMINRLNPEFASEMEKNKKDAAKLLLLKKHLESQQAENNKHTSFLRDYISSVIDVRIIQEGKFAEVNRSLYAGFDYLLRLLQDEYQKGLTSVDTGRDTLIKHPIANNLYRDEKRYSDFIKVLDERILTTASSCLDKDKTIKGLFLLPKLTTDQELIVFFGNNFHVTFSKIDAYTGLLYTAEYFDFEGTIRRDYLLAIVLSETPFLKKELIEEQRQREEERRREEAEKRRKEEEDRKKKKYQDAENAFANKDYQLAKSMFEGLGDYKDSKAKELEVVESERLDSYEKAHIAFSSKEYRQALSIFEGLGRYRDSQEKAESARKEIQKIQAEEQRKRAIEKEKKKQEEIENNKKKTAGALISQWRRALEKEIEGFLNDGIEAIEKAVEEKAKEEAEIRSLQSKIKALEEERSSLGLFKGDARRKIGSEIFGISDEISNRRLKTYELNKLSILSSHRWQVIDFGNANNRALAVTEGNVAQKPYHAPGGQVTWENCTLRQWLNGDFYSSLRPNIRSCIIEVLNTNPDAGKDGNTSNKDPVSENSTKDKVFLLSYREYRKHISDITYGPYEMKKDYSGWLRSRMYDNNKSKALALTTGFHYFYSGYPVEDCKHDVTPAIWIDISRIKIDFDKYLNGSGYSDSIKELTKAGYKSDEAAQVFFRKLEEFNKEFGTTFEKRSDKSKQ